MVNSGRRGPFPVRWPWRGRSGFTLLEVMIAVAIVGVVLVTVLGSAAQSVSVAAVSRFNVTAAALAQQRLFALERLPYADLADDEGDFGDDYPGYRYRVEVQEIDGADLGLETEGLRFKLVDLSVFFQDPDRYNLHLRTLVAPGPGG